MTISIKPKRCRKCGNSDIYVWDCGYSTFNPGGAKCRGCGYEVKVSDCNSKADVIIAWNEDGPTELEQARQQIKLLNSRIRLLKKEKKEYEATFALQWEAARKASDFWREHHPNKDTYVDPDLTKLFNWLVEMASDGKLREKVERELERKEKNKIINGNPP